MLDIISTAKNTQWISFPTLCSKFTYSHVANEAVDFQVISGKNCFAEFNKKFGFELLRTVSRDNKDVIQRVKKRQVDDLSCGAISKVCGSEIAIGMTTGFIRIFSVQTGDYMPLKFKPDRIGNSVTGLDYYNTDEYLAAVYDNSDISVFGLKTGIKTDTLRCDGLSTLVRFHPSRKLTLAIGSYEGAITMLDIQAKRKLFFDKTAHNAPIRDISMFDSQDVFATCGYDCNINIFDMRKRSKVQQHKQSHPMSSICVSSCGKLCVAGNLKGEVTSFDFRSMKEPLDTKRMHDDAVVRVAFIPSVTDSNMTLGIEHSPKVDSLYKSTCSSTSVFASQQLNGRGSFAKFVDVCHYNNLAVTGDATPRRRDSWTDLMSNRKINDFSMDSVLETPRVEVTRRSSRISVDADVSDFGSAKDENTPQRPRRSNTLDFDKKSDLQKIEEELSKTDVAQAGHNGAIDNRKPLGVSDNRIDSLAGRKRRSTFHDQFSMHIKNTNTSSPTFHMRNDNIEMILPMGESNSDGKNDRLRAMLTGVVDNKLSSLRVNLSSKLETATTELKSQMDQRTDTAANEMKDVLEHFYLLGLQGGDNLFNRLGEPFERLEGGLCDLMERDQYALEYFRMKFEIIELKKKLGIRDPNILDYLK